MRRRPTTSDPGFGSDSFLDVLSNIVGILIILIVMAGMQLGRLPLNPGPATSAPTTTPLAAVAAPVIRRPDPAPAAVATPKPPVPTLAEEPAPELPPLAPPADALRELADADAQRADLLSATATAESELATTRQRRRQTEQQFAGLDQAASEAQAQLDQRKSQLQTLRAELLREREQLSGLLAEFEETEQAAPPTQAIRHRLAPVSQEVQGEELHFRVSGGRVSFVPLGELLDRVKLQLQRRRELAAARGGYQGRVGPVDGYSLEFEIEARRMSPHEERVHGLREGYTIELSRCTVIPDPSFQGETPEQALQRGSRFAMALRTASQDASITFWTYPDSFGEFRVLQAACQAEGFLVAGRPLPHGQNIMGDRRLGTRSAAQ
ncbi:MAG: hypothetical protein ACKOGA_12880 [Planctomycetaceae bacterium]